MTVEFIEQFAYFYVGFIILVLAFDWLVKRYDLFPEQEMLHKVLNWGVICVFILSFTQMFFGIFEGVIQSFVLTMLTTVYLTMGLKQDDDHESQESKEVA